MTPGDGRLWLPAVLLLLQVPGCSCLSGPTSVTGTVGGSLSVQCQYEEEFTENVKYWCKSPCLGDIVVTKEADIEVRSGRVSIRDHPANLTFTVTLENLTESDTGTYRCGIDTSLLPEYLLDLNFRVVLSVTPGLHWTLPDPTQKTATSQESPSSRQHPGSSPRSHPIEDQASKGEERSLLSSIYFQLLVFLEVPLVLSMLSAVL
ncbi:CMRF-35-like molecule 4 isoform X1 [Mustela putorius furo]|uniref:CMRF-35-like molecule 4 isoform X1 n=1 Tax=Mustela putorius furo TaxID=9669 RepID=A0A8U0MNT2_MUSPF|nr:CMRF-35-like molecule 4 isoform X1 [Mustela putorius furo]